MLCYRNYTTQELAKYDGIKDERILLAIMRVPRDGKIPGGGKCERTVFDVTMGRNFYGPGGSAWMALTDRMNPINASEC